jgi:hypothetical protein
MKFITKNSSHSALHFCYWLTYMKETVNTKFLDLKIDNHIHWKNYIGKMVPELSAVCHVAGRKFHISNINTLKSIYYAYFQSIIRHGTILWGNSSNSGKILTLQKTIVIIMAAAQPRTSCTSLFKQLEILPVTCQCILSLMSGIVNYHDIFHTNSSIHNNNTRNKHHLHRSNANLSCFQKKKKYIQRWHKNVLQFTTYSNNPQEKHSKV